MSLEDRAGVRDVGLKMQEEAGELANCASVQNLRDKLADCAIALFAAAAIAEKLHGIKLEAAIFDKLPRVIEKYKPK